MNLIGWQAYYDTGEEFSSEDFEWKDLPLNGLLAVTEFYDDGTTGVHHSKDYYVLDDGKVFGTSNIHPYLAKLGTIKYGRWSKNSKFQEILSKARCAQSPTGKM